MPRTREDNQRIKDDRREQILHSALYVFAAKGLNAAKISDIAERSGISQGLMYRYYASKEEIFVALIRTAIERMNKAATQLELMQEPAGTKVDLAIGELFKGLDSNKETALYYLLLTQAAVSEAVPQEAKDLLKTKNLVQHKVMQNIFLQGQKDGVINEFSCSDLSLLFWATINGLALIKAVRGDDFKLPSKEIFRNMFFKKDV